MKSDEVEYVEEEVPFGPDPEEYDYCCSNCNYECEVNEVIIDVESKSWEDSMPILRCPNCSKRTLKHVKDD